MSETIGLNISENYSAMLRPPMWLGMPLSITPYLLIFQASTFVLNPLSSFIALPFVWLTGYSLGKFDPDFAKVLDNIMDFKRDHVTDKESHIRAYRG